MIFFLANMDSVRIVMRVFDDFPRLLGLVINPEKSHVFLLEVDDELEISLQTLLGFRRGSLAIRYLGVLLISTILTHINCMVLVEWIFFMIKLWASISLTYVGYLQLIKFVLFSIQVYRSFMFIIPYFIIKRIKGILTTFLWKCYSF